MLFKNFMIYIFDELPAFTPDSFAAALFTPCGPHDAVRSGLVPPVGEPVYHQGPSGLVLFAFKQQQKVIPSAALNEIVAAKVLELGRPVGRKERQQLKEEALFSALPRALVTSNTTHFFIDPVRKRLVIDTSSTARANQILDCLRRALGSLPVEAYAPDLARVLDVALLYGLPEGTRLAAGDDYTLAGKGGANAATFRRFDSCEAVNQLQQENGLSVTSLRMALLDADGDEAVRFTVNTSGHFTRVVFTPFDSEWDSFAELIDANLLVMSATLADLHGALFKRGRP